MNERSSFTLIELLVVIAILAILSVTVVLVINPADIIRQTRDSTRLTDLNNLNKAIGVFTVSNAGSFVGTSTVIYVSVPDSSDTCANLNLPALPGSYTYHCVASASSTKNNGTGWVPIDFTQISYGAAISKLPIDPVNSTTTGEYYSYIPGGSWELNGILTSNKYRYNASIHKENMPGVLSIGSNKTLSPIYNNSGLIAYYPLAQENQVFQGTDLLSGWSLQSGWTTGTVTVNSPNQFTGNCCGGGGIYKALFSVGSRYSLVITGTYSGAFAVYNASSNSNLLHTGSGGVISATINFVAVDSYINLTSYVTGGVVNITSMTLKKEQAADVTPNSYHGTITPGSSIGYATNQKNVTNRAYDFDGGTTSGTYISTSNVNSFEGDYSVSLWFQKDDGNYNHLIGKAGSLVNGAVFWLRVANTGAGGKLQYSINGSQIESTTVPVAGQWYHAVITRDGSLRKIYVNGILENSGAIGSPESNSNVLEIGRKPGIAEQSFNGRISDVRVYSRALSAAEVLAIYNSTR
ncbi:MAG: LamG-like jellyroll fold domain-containing protein [bacterium]|nr:LamG-like jellyroll fold domain-containing protein [bacterium]